jgi:hypothetical protein
VEGAPVEVVEASPAVVVRHTLAAVVAVVARHTLAVVAAVAADTTNPPSLCSR